MRAVAARCTVSAATALARFSADDLPYDHTDHEHARRNDDQNFIPLHRLFLLFFVVGYG